MTAQATEEPMPLIDDLRARIAHLTAENQRLQRLVSAQGRLITNANLTDKSRALGFSLLTQAAAKRARGDVGADGRPRVSAGEITNDFRVKPAKGGALALTNPNGTRPITKRSDARPIITGLRDAGALAVRLEPTVRRHPSGDSYADTSFVVEPGDLVAAIARLADFRPPKVRKTYIRQSPCIHCGEIHPLRLVTTRQVLCTGCGSLLSEEETVETLPVPTANDPQATGDERMELESITAA